MCHSTTFQRRQPARRKKDRNQSRDSFAVFVKVFQMNPGRTQEKTLSKHGRLEWSFIMDPLRCTIQGELLYMYSRSQKRALARLTYLAHQDDGGM